MSHQDQVIEPPEGAELLAGHEFCPHDMLRIGDHVLTLQGHPEFGSGYSQAIMDMRRETLGEETYRDGVASLGHSIDSDVAAAWIRSFIARARGEAPA